MANTFMRTKGLHTVISNKELRHALQEQGMFTVGDLIACPLIHLMCIPKVLAHWSELSTALASLQRFYA